MTLQKWVLKKERFIFRNKTFHKSIRKIGQAQNFSAEERERMDQNLRNFGRTYTEKKTGRFCKHLVDRYP